MNARSACFVAGLALIAIGVAQPSAAAPSRSRRKAAVDSNEVLIRFGRDAITRKDVQRRIESLPEQFRTNYTTPEGRQQLLDRMGEERVWLTEAQRHGVADRPSVKQQIEQQRRDLLIRTYLNDLMAKNATVSDADAKAYYDSHSGEFHVPATISVRQIQTKTEADVTRATGGNLGVITRDGAFGTLGMQPALAESAFALREGQIGGPYKTDKGWHVIRVDQVKPESTRPFDQVKALISRQLGSQRQQDFYHAQLDSARRSQAVVADSSAIRRFLSTRRTAREMFNDAQALGPADQRLAAYRKLLDEYPDSDVSPQAQFMIGFINSEELKNYDAAEKAFRALLAKYPKAELAASAKWMIDHMRSATCRRTRPPRRRAAVPRRPRSRRPGRRRRSEPARLPSPAGMQCKATSRKLGPSCPSGRSGAERERSRP